MFGDVAQPSPESLISGFAGCFAVVAALTVAAVDSTDRAPPAITAAALALTDMVSPFPGHGPSVSPLRPGAPAIDWPNRLRSRRCSRRSAPRPPVGDKAGCWLRR